MEKQQLLDYLKAAMDMETAVYACKQAVQKVNSAIAAPYKPPVVPELQYADKPAPSRLVLPRKPQAPVLEQPEEIPLPKLHYDSDDILECFLNVITLSFHPLRALIVALICTALALPACGVIYLFWRDDLQKLITPVCCVSIAVVALGYILMNIFRPIIDWKQDTQETKRKNAAAKQQARQQYDNDLRTYKQAMADFEVESEKARQSAITQTQHELQLWQADNRKREENYEIMLDSAGKIQTAHDQRMATLRKERMRLDDKLIELEGMLESFYNQNVLFYKYRNHAAIAQIYDYLASGIADQLEGPHGAYAHYEDDLRAVKICDSIEQLRRDVREEIAKVIEMQYSICEELRSCEYAIRDVGNAVWEIDNDFTSFRRDFDSAVSGFADNMSELSDSVVSIGRRADAYRNVLSSISSGIEDISSTSRKTAYNTAMIGLNQYLDMKTRGVNAYYASYGS